MTSTSSMAPKPPAQKLTVHIIGAGAGESIVIQMPDNKWGVVDCYAADPDDPGTNETYKFLKENGCKELEFLCLTHPHDDHYRGMSRLLSDFKVNLFWRFPGLAKEDTPEFFEVLKGLIKAPQRVGDLNLAERTVNDLEQTFKLVKNQRKAAVPLRVNEVLCNLITYPSPVPALAALATQQLIIRGIAPPSNSSDVLKRLLTSASKKLQSRTTGKKSSHGHRSDLTFRANDVSVGLIIEFGKSRVILGGDVESAAWSSAMKECTPDNFAIDGAKVSHHGSKTGHCPGLWASFSQYAKPVAVICPSHRHQLPDAQTLKHIRQHASAVFATCPIHPPKIKKAPWDPLVVAHVKIRNGRRKVQKVGRVSLTFSSDGGAPTVKLFGAAVQLFKS